MQTLRPGTALQSMGTCGFPWLVILPTGNTGLLGSKDLHLEVERTLASSVSPFSVKSESPGTPSPLSTLRHLRLFLLALMHVCWETAG